MCVIVHLPAGTMLTSEHLFNATHNNWHSWGVVLKKDGKLHVEKHCPENGNDPAVIEKYLKDNIDCERVLHLRHNTRGGTSMLNAQPFLAYQSNKREVWFCHNGTLYEFGSNKNDEDAKSDTLEYVEKILSPALLHWHGENGNADYTSKMFWELIMSKRWTAGSRGLFIANDLPVITVGDGWKDYKAQEKIEGHGIIRVSNDDYFDRISRGPFHEKMLEEERRQREAEAAKNTKTHSGYTGGGTPSTVTTKIFRESELKKSSLVLENIAKVYEDMNADSPVALENLGYVDYQEWLMLCDKESNFYIAALLGSMGTAITELMENNRSLEARMQRMHDRIQKEMIEKAQAA